jgi:hypothetical protein
MTRLVNTMKYRYDGAILPKTGGVYFGWRRAVLSLYRQILTVHSAFEAIISRAFRLSLRTEATQSHICVWRGLPDETTVSTRAGFWVAIDDLPVFIEK